MVNNASGKVSKKTKKTKENPAVECDICLVTCTSKIIFKQHCRGRKHKKNLLTQQAQQLRNKNKHAHENSSPDSSSLKSETNQDSNATEVKMNASNKNLKKSKRNLFKNNGYYPNQQYPPFNESQFYPNNHHQQYPNQHQLYPNDHQLYPNQHQPYPYRNHQQHNFRQNRGKNWHSQPPQGSFLQRPWNFRNDYDPKDFNLCNGHESSVNDGSSVEEIVVLADVHAPNNSHLSENTISADVQQSDPRNSVDSNEVNHLPQCQPTPVASGKKLVTKSPVDEKQVEKRSILMENVTEKIAHWINPSNPKDKAEVIRMVTEFSKSKKKENLLKLKLQADSSSNENSCDIREETFISNTHSNNVKPINHRTIAKKRSNSETVQQIGNINPFISNETSSTASPRKKRLRRFRTSTESLPKTSRRRSLSNSIAGESFISESAQVLREVAAEKKQKEEKSGASKKHKCSTAECLESCINEAEKTSQVNKETTASVSPILSTSRTDISTLNPAISEVYNPDSAVEVPKVSVKREKTDEGLNMQLHPCLLEAFTLEDHLRKPAMGNVNPSDEATVSPVESLIDLFTSGNIKIKKEFDDPLIDVIRTVDPEILNRVCEGQSLQPAIQESPIENEGSIAEKPSAKKTSVIDGTDGEEAINYLPFFKSSIKNILNEIQSLSSLEEELKKNQEQADSKIQEYQALVDEWKTKKIKFLSEEETLRKQRNNLVRTMADLVTQCNVEQSIAADIATQKDSVLSSLTPVTDNNVSSSSSNSSVQQKLKSKHGAQSNVKSTKKILSSETEDIAILPPPVKSTNIPVIDLEECLSPESTSTSENWLSSDADVILEKFGQKRNYVAHSTIINCIQVFEDHIYTAANDSTAKRFSLKGCMEIVTYYHPKKNVIQLCVEKVRGWTLLFTICSASKEISSFKAEDGVLFRRFNLSSIVSCICKGRGLIYAGLRTGTIVVCNWKEHKEIVNTSEPIRCIDTTTQGCLNILVTLSTSGSIWFRDADRNGLLIRYVKARSYIPLFMTVCSDSIYLSSAGVLTVLNIESGKFVTKYSFSTAYTCLTVYKDSIFTASYSGIVRCYSKNEEKPVKMYYGAGGNSITCIHVYNGWVFTANRTGLISAFKYDPNTSHSCEIEKCDFIFPQLEDLEWHVLKDHDLPKAKAQCTWRKCQFIIPYNWDTEAVKAHMKNHL